MANKTLIVFICFDVFFVLCAAVQLLIPLSVRAARGKSPTLHNIAIDLLLDQCPLRASMVNAGIGFLAFFCSIPAFFKRSSRRFLQLHSWLVVVSALITLGIGLFIWFETLQTRANLEPIWNSQSTYIQSMLQYKFQCCGYRDSQVFVQDTTCTSAADAARLGGCVGPFSVFANQFLDIVFTSIFGICAIDMMLLLSVLCVLKNRRETERYRLIDEKAGSGGI